MKILFASTPAQGHVNPMLAIAHILMADGHEIVFHTGSAFNARVTASGAKFVSLSGDADFDPSNVFERLPQLKTTPPGLDWLRIACEGIFVDNIAAQDESLRKTLRTFPADIIIADDMFFGLIPMLLGPRPKRPPVVMCGTSLLHWPREDGAPNFLGLPPAETPEQREEFAAMAQKFEDVVDGPVRLRLNQVLKKLGVKPTALALFDTAVGLSDSYMQLSVPGFEFPREIPRTVHFVGTPPIIPNQVPLPPWADDLDGSRKVVLVTQGTVANHNFGLLVGPTLQALANEPDVLVVATAGGRPIDAIPGPVPSNARIASFLPFEWILPKVNVLVTNGGYGSVNQAMSKGVPLVTAGLTEDKADVNARVAWSGVGINLAANEPTPDAIRQAVRSVLDQPAYRQRALQMAEEFAGIDTRSEIRWIVSQLVADHRAGSLTASRGRRAAG